MQTRTPAAEPLGSDQIWTAGFPSASTVAILGLGHCLPPNILTNEDLARTLDTSDAWVLPRTGIRSRHIAAPTQATSDLAVQAALSALAAAAVAPNQIDLILVATATPDSPVPPTAALVQQRLPGCTAAAMDLSAACAGFIFATHTAAAFIRSGMHRRVLVIGAETLSRITDYSDRSTCILFGDGAGAVVLGAPGADPSRAAAQDGPLELLYSQIGTTSRDADLIRIVAGGSRHPASEETVRRREHFLRLNGREVFRRAVQTMTAAARESLRILGLSITDIRWLVPHQANARILYAVAEALEAPPHAVVADIEHVGNTSAASLPIALDRLRRRVAIAPGELIMLLTFGAGASWGCQVYRQLAS